MSFASVPTPALRSYPPGRDDPLPAILKALGITNMIFDGDEYKKPMTQWELIRQLTPPEKAIHEHEGKFVLVDWPSGAVIFFRQQK